MIAFRRIADDGSEIIAVCNFVPVTREDYKIGVPFEGRYELLFSTDAPEFGGQGRAKAHYDTIDFSMHGFDQCVSLTLPALSVLYLKRVMPSKTRQISIAELADRKAEEAEKKRSKK